MNYSTAFDAVPEPGRIVCVIRAGARAVVIKRVRMVGSNLHVALRLRVRRGLTAPTGGGTPIEPSHHDPLSAPALHTIAPWDIGAPFVDPPNPGHDLAGQDGALAAVEPNAQPAAGEFPYVIRAAGWLALVALNTVGAVRIEIETSEPAHGRTPTVQAMDSTGILYPGPATLTHLRVCYAFAGPPAWLQLHDVNNVNDLATGTIIPTCIYPVNGSTVSDLEVARHVQFLTGIGWGISSARLTWSPSVGTASVAAEWDRR